MRVILISSLLTFFYHLASAQQLYEIPDGATTRWSSFENPSAGKGIGGQENLAAKGHAFDVISANSSKTMLDYKGAGIINRIWLTVDQRSPAMLRSVKIEMYWDNSDKPAVSVPLGDFFGVGLGRKTPFQNEFFSDPEGRSFNCYIPMPFKTGARIVMVNESSKPVTLFYDVNFTALQKHDKNVLYFHAFWNRENKTKLGRDFTILPTVNGKGRFVGTNIGVAADTIYGTSWFGEGEVKMYIDGDSKFPTLIGTGTEDYIGTAWGQGAFANRYQGCPVADEKSKQWCFYRFHVPDPVYFQNQIRVTIQQIGGEGTEFVRKLALKGAVIKPVSVSGDKFYKILEMNPVPDIRDEKFPKGWTNYYREDDVSATAYFYLDKAVSNLPALMGVAERVRGLSEK